uniref:Electron transfer protein n=1 Tax=Piromyces sp. TaxID=45796 RepID=A0A2S1TZG5_PIRSP|nr:Electron transfer protein [Piromyces sp.]
MTKALFVIAHPNIEQSTGNKTIIEAYKKFNIDTEYDEIYKLYPDYKIDVKAEQEKLLKADVVVLQFPMYWYNAPSLLRKWFEDVLEHGFAYGSQGKALKDKRLIVSLTTGAPLDAFKEGGFQNFTIDDLTKGFHQLANLCSLTWEDFIATGGVNPFVKNQPEQLKVVIEDLKKHAKLLADRINV